MKRFLAVALTVLMIVPMLAFSASAEAVSPDTSWYSESATEFVLKDAADLLGFNQLAASNTFAGKTVKLGADITLNEGEASAWKETAPAIKWTPVRFAGTFDGQGFSISGLYSTGNSKVAFFSDLVGGTIKNLSILNSYFAAQSGGNASAFIAMGAGDKITVEKCYTDAIIYSGAYNCGGFIATMGSALEGHFINCWFDGDLSMVYRYGAGIVANGEGKKVYVDGCLNSGTVYTVNDLGANSHIAGIFGRNDGSSYITNCLNTGKVTTLNLETGKDDVIGALMGSCSKNDKTQDGKAWLSHVSISNSWATTESCVAAFGNNSSADPSQLKDYGMISEEMLKGYGAYSNTNLDFENIWAVNMAGAPVLRAFTPEDQIPPLYKVNNPSLKDYELKAEGHYGPRWYVEVKIPEGMKKEDVKIGLLVVPTKALPKGHKLTVNDTAFEHRGNEYEVANVEGKILRESEEDTLLASFVITDFAAANCRDNFTVRPYAVYTVEGGEIVTYGEDDNATFYKDAVLTTRDEAADASLKAALNAVLAPIYEGLGGEFPVLEEWSELEEFVEVPAYKVDNITISETESYGPELALFGNPTNVVCLDWAVDKNYYEYRELLEKYGFELYVDNGETGLNDSVYTAIYTKGDLVVTVTMLSYQNQLFITSTFDMPLSEHLFDKFSDDVIEGKKETLSMLEMFRWGNSYVIQLKNGHFLINDGAGDYEFPYLMEYLQKLAGEGNPVVIEGWFVTHAHYDHYCIIRGLAQHPEFIPENFYVEGFYVNMPGEKTNALDVGVYNEMDQVFAGMNAVKTTKGETPKIYRPMTGQKYYFSDHVVEIVMSQEQVHISEYQGGFNESSTWYKYNFNVGDGKTQSFLVGGDSHVGGMTELIRSYDPEYLEADVFSVLHHTYNTWDEFTNYLDFKTLFVPQREKSVPAANKTLFDKALANGGEVFWEGNGNVMLTFPYKVGEGVQAHEFAWQHAHVYGLKDGEKIAGA